MMADVAARSDRLELLLLRHADAGDSMAWTRPDAERPLSSKGHRQAARVADTVVDDGNLHKTIAVRRHADRHQRGYGIDGRRPGDARQPLRLMPPQNAQRLGQPRLSGNMARCGRDGRYG